MADAIIHQQVDLVNPAFQAEELLGRRLCHKKNTEGARQRHHVLLALGDKDILRAADYPRDGEHAPDALSFKHKTIARTELMPVCKMFFHQDFPARASAEI